MLRFRLPFSVILAYPAASQGRLILSHGSLAPASISFDVSGFIDGPVPLARFPITSPTPDFANHLEWCTGGKDREFQEVFVRTASRSGTFAIGNRAGRTIS